MAKNSQGIIAYWTTTTVAVATAASNVIGEVVGFNGPGMSANVIDVSSLQSTAKEKMIGLYDAGQMTLSVNCMVTDGGQTLLRECMVARTKGILMLQLSTAATTQKLTMEGYVNGLSITGAVDQKLAADITILISGGCAFTT